MNKKDEYYAKKYKLTKGEVLFTLGMGVPEPQEDAPACRDRAFGEGDEWRMLFVGELSSRKNQRFLIAALPEISQRVPRAALYLAGEGDARDELLALAAGLSVSDRVHFLGKRTDVRRLMRECDLYVSAAMIEGMPFNLIEAMDEGATVLASRIKGHEDLVSDGEDGFLFEFGNKDEFVNKACQIADGASVLDKNTIISKAKKYSKNNVFRDTLGILKRASGLGEGEEN